MKIKDYEQSEELLKSSKEEREVARDEFKAFRVENKIKKDEPPTDAKLLKKYNSLLAQKEKKEKEVDEIVAWRKENKPKKEPKIRETKYDYPAECTTTIDKKKFRASERARIKREAKEAAGGGKKEKKADKKEEKGGKEKKGTPKEEPKMSKAERRALKKAEEKKGKPKEVASPAQED